MRRSKIASPAATLRLSSVVLPALCLVLAGCALPQLDPPGTRRSFDVPADTLSSANQPLPPLDRPATRRPFHFPADTFAFANELVWEYRYDEHGKWVSQPRVPKPDYSHHCFVVASSVKQFLEHARFDAAQPVADEETYRQLVRKVTSIRASRTLPDSEKIVIPGYADLRSFSEAHAALLKSECGGAWHSYFQHGHWRMIMPFSRHHQDKTAHELLAEVNADDAPVVHLVRFPQLTINHAVLLFAATETPDTIRFSAYDPNDPKEPVMLTYNRATRTFELPANDYFPGGRVDVYEVYKNWLY